MFLLPLLYHFCFVPYDIIINIWVYINQSIPNAYIVASIVSMFGTWKTISQCVSRIIVSFDVECVYARTHMYHPCVGTTVNVSAECVCFYRSACVWSRSSVRHSVQNAEFRFTYVSVLIVINGISWPLAVGWFWLLLLLFGFSVRRVASTVNVLIIVLWFNEPSLRWEMKYLD